MICALGAGHKSLSRRGTHSRIANRRDAAGLCALAAAPFEAERPCGQPIPRLAFDGADPPSVAPPQLIHRLVHIDAVGEDLPVTRLDPAAMLSPRCLGSVECGGDSRSAASRACDDSLYNYSNEHLPAPSPTLPGVSGSLVRARRPDKLTQQLQSFAQLELELPRFRRQFSASNASPS